MLFGNLYVYIDWKGKTDISGNLYNAKIILKIITYFFFFPQSILKAKKNTGF